MLFLLIGILFYSNIEKLFLGRYTKLLLLILCTKLDLVLTHSPHFTWIHDLKAPLRPLWTPRTQGWLWVWTLWGGSSWQLRVTLEKLGGKAVLWPSEVRAMCVSKERRPLRALSERLWCWRMHLFVLLLYCSPAGHVSLGTMNQVEYPCSCRNMSQNLQNRSSHKDSLADRPVGADCSWPNSDYINLSLNDHIISLPSQKEKKKGCGKPQLQVISGNDKIEL